MDDKLNHSPMPEEKSKVEALFSSFESKNEYELTGDDYMQARMRRQRRRRKRIVIASVAGALVAVMIVFVCLFDVDVSVKLQKGGIFNSNSINGFYEVPTFSDPELGFLYYSKASLVCRVDGEKSCLLLGRTAIGEYECVFFLKDEAGRWTRVDPNNGYREVAGFYDRSCEYTLYEVKGTKDQYVVFTSMQYGDDNIQFSDSAGTSFIRCQSGGELYDTYCGFLTGYNYRTYWMTVDGKQKG